MIYQDEEDKIKNSKLIHVENPRGDDWQKYVDYCISIVPDGIWAEFGVGNGASILYLARKTNKIYGFDHFEGLHEDWGEYKKGSFTCYGEISPILNKPNIEIVKGYFEKTLPKFILRNNKRFALIHIDCDLYSSTVTILKNIRRKLQTGTIIMFDEIITYGEKAREHELRAFIEFKDKHNIKYEWIAHTNYSHATLRIL